MRLAKIFIRVLISFALLFVGFQIGVQVERLSSDSEGVVQRVEGDFMLAGSGVTVQEDPEAEVNMDLFWTVWNILHRSYVDPAKLEIDNLRFGAIHGLVQGIGDPFSAFMTPRESQDFQDSLAGTLQGIGAELMMRKGSIVVVAPLKGSPAARAGLLPQDIILMVDDVDVSSMDLNEAVQLIRGEQGTEVTLTIFRPSSSEELSITITRDVITVPSVEHEVLETASGSVGYVSVNQFGELTTLEVGEALQDLVSKDLKGVIIDLRFNGGGYLESAVEIASYFLNEGKVVSVHRRDGVESHSVLGNPIMADMPLVVLINEGSASASEILSGALQDHKRAHIMGKTSFGKGTVQEVVELPGGSSMRVTIAEWKTPDGNEINLKGVTPDTEVEIDMEAYLEGDDAQKNAAVEYLLR